MSKVYCRSIFIVQLFIPMWLYGQSWVQGTKIISQHRNSEDYFGWATSGDGQWAVSSSSGDDLDSLGQNNINGSGAVFIYRREQNGEWGIHQKINSSDREISERFGWSVSIHGDILLVGAVYNRTNHTGIDSLINSGAVFVFRRNSNDQWIQESKLVPSDRLSGDRFGWSLDIYENLALVGAPYKLGDTTGGKTGNDAGAVYLFKRDQTGNWSQIQKLVSTDQNDNDLYGSAVGIEGNFIVVGAKGQDLDSNQGNYKNSSGAIYIYKEGVNNNWNETQKIVPIDRKPFMQFGNTISISSGTIACGVYLESFDEIGLNQKDTAGAAYIFSLEQNKWSQSQKIVAPDRQKLDQFGWSIDVKNKVLAIGARFESHDTLGIPIPSSGSVYLYNKANTKWNYIKKLKAKNTQIADWFGTSVSICDSLNLIVGSNNSYDLNDQNKILNAGSIYTYYKDIYVGVDDFKNPLKELKLYPNPTNGNLTIELGQTNQSINIELYNINGQRIQDDVYTNLGKLHYSINNEKGVYLMKIIIENQVHTEKIIKY